MLDLRPFPTHPRNFQKSKKGGFLFLQHTKLSAVAIAAVGKGGNSQIGLSTTITYMLGYQLENLHTYMLGYL